MAPAKINRDLRVPFDKSGNQLSWASYWLREEDRVERCNEPFVDTLTYMQIERGRSAATAIFVRKSTGTRVAFFLGEFERVASLMVRGEVTGTFAFRKQGANFSCTLVETQ